MENLNNFQLLEYAAWGISAVLGLWMLFDMIRTNGKYSEADAARHRRKARSRTCWSSIRPHQGGHR